MTDLEWTAVHEDDEVLASWERHHRETVIPWENYIDQLLSRPDNIEGDFYLTREDLGMKPEDAYIRAKLLAGLLAGENDCLWAAWFQAHHQHFDREPSDFNSAKWKMEHTELLAKSRDLWDGKGYSVAVEWQNVFRLRGRTGIVLTGKPDLIAVNGDRGIIEDAKTGHRRDADPVQVMIYMWAVPQCFPEYRNVSFRGRLVYKDGTKVRIPSEAVDNAFERRLVRLVERVGGSTPLRKAPSSGECRWCPISKTACPERVVQPQDRPPAGTDRF